MTVEYLYPDLGLMSEQYVLVQAWKKTSSYIRYHNWFADTLALDYAAVNLPQFLEGVSKRLLDPEGWVNTPLRIVPAPKSQEWLVHKSGEWKPRKSGETAKKMRPLAHVDIEDQVAATALMMCLADRVETMQGDPKLPIDEPGNRQNVTSYGNRLYCGKSGVALHHRWGSTKLYRGFFQDYQQFLARPEIVAEGLPPGAKIVIIHSDLANFYDRVHPNLLAEKLTTLQYPDDDQRFFQIARSILSWQWDGKDSKEVYGYAEKAELGDFSRVALPQGLVASGFFSNIVLMDFDRNVRSNIGSIIAPGIVLHDVCRYVDDIRLVLTIAGNIDLDEIENEIIIWLQQILDSSSSELRIAPEKTRAVLFRGDERPLVRQGRKMQRIQQAISGGFDAIEGGEILDTIRALVRTQNRYSEKRLKDQGWQLTPIPDVRDETVARFAAARFRSTFRSLRPLLESKEEIKGVDEKESQTQEYPHLRKTQEDLDDEARSFALGLIENWVEDPSNVRLLRVGLDLWPDASVLKRILEILLQYTSKGGGRKAPRRVAWYCLSEIFRAGATETGFVDGGERLPDKIDIDAYRTVLFSEGVRLIALPSVTLPWYLKQQVFLFLAAFNPIDSPILGRSQNPESKYYRDLLRYLKGETRGLLDRDFATLAILSRRAFLGENKATLLANDNISPNRAKLIAEKDPAFGLELFTLNPGISRLVSPKIQHDLCLPHQQTDTVSSLAGHVLNGSGLLRNELSLLQFAEKFLQSLQENPFDEAITPCDVEILINQDVDGHGVKSIDEVKITPNRRYSPSESIYSPPIWCPLEARWRYQLGYLLRFILTEHVDFTQTVRKVSWKESTSIYRRILPHWFQRTYGYYSGHSAFGADWLPISDWTEQFLYALLAWPGCQPPEFAIWISLGIEITLSMVKNRICHLQNIRGDISNTLIVPLSSGWPYRNHKNIRTLRACVVQTVIPGPDHFKSDTDDLELLNPATRKKHRNHLSAALAAVVKMLQLRETHLGKAGQLDLLILPELSVHPLDVETHLVPFARAYKTIILAGITYEKMRKGGLLANSALWVIPVWYPGRGLEILRRRQGKRYLAKEERALNDPIARLEGYRPCQWLIGYEWNPYGFDNPLYMTASVCYDATDIKLAADLRTQSDLFIVPALNQDVNTFDQMALALHYHMYQMVIVANNGTFGGSNAYAPYNLPYKRQIFHLHGQPQATIGFIEIDNIAEFINRRNENIQAFLTDEEKEKKNMWKCPPAGMTP